MVQRVRALALLCLLGCNRDEPVVDGERLSVREPDARQVSSFTAGHRSLVADLANSPSDIRESVSNASPRVLASVLKNGDADSRADAAWRLSLLLDDSVYRSQLSPADFERVHNALASARHDPERTVRIHVVRGLAAAGKLPKSMLILRLRQEIPNAPTDLQVRGASVLWNLTHRVEDVRNSYLAALRSDDPGLRLEALDEIMKMRSAARPLAKAVEKLRDDPEHEVRERAARTLASIAG